METTMRSLLSDYSRYLESFHLFLQNSTEHQAMQDFIETRLPNVVSSIGEGKSAINVLGVGSGSGEIDLQIFSKIQARYPGVTINTDIVEPSPEQTLSYKELVAKTPGLENINFTWHKKTSSEFELEVKEKSERKYDFIHMIEMLYFVKDMPATVRFFRSLLAPNGKLLIILASGNSGWFTLWNKYGSRLPLNDLCLYITTSEIANMLSAEGAKYEVYDLPSDMDITECFIDGDKNGELLLDFLTQTCDFNKNAPPELREEIIQDLKSLGCSSVKDGKVIFNNNLSAIVVKSD